MFCVRSVPQIAELQETIDLLETIKTLDNIVVADVFTENSREEIRSKKNFENIRSHLSFKPKNLVEQGNHIFRSMILATSNYFYSIFEKKALLMNKLKELDNELSLVN